MILCHPTTEVCNVVPWQWEPIASLMTYLCMHLIPNCFLGIGILSAIRNALLLLVIAPRDPENEIPEPYPIIACTLQCLEYLLLLTSTIYLVL